MTTAPKKTSGARGLILVILFTLLLGLPYFLSANRDYQAASELCVSGMLAAGYQDVDLSQVKYGQNTFAAWGQVYDSESPQSDNYINNFIFGARNYPKEDISVSYTRPNQIGTQGWLLYYAGKAAAALRLPPKAAYLGCKLAVCYLFLFVILAIGYQLKKAYNGTFALVFCLVSLASTELQNFSTNLYWLPFTWFLPMLLGLICLNYPKKRFYVYPLMALALAMKSAFGYEYIPNIMLGAILFLGTECICAWRSDRKRAILLLRTIFGVGISCLIGFFAVLAIHGYIRGDGSMGTGIRLIYEQDILRRTFGNAADFEDFYAPSLNATVLQVLLKYTFTTASGLLSLILLVLNAALALRARKHRSILQWMVLILCGYVFSNSWFILAKSHSYIHMFSDVVFYLPFIQIAVYYPVRQLMEALQKSPALAAGNSANT